MTNANDYTALWVEGEGSDLDPGTMQVGSIVRKDMGWTPMEVKEIQITGYISPNCRIRYCRVNGEDAHLDDEWRPMNTLTLITDYSEITQCPDWSQRLSKKQAETLCRQVADHKGFLMGAGPSTVLGRESGGYTGEDVEDILSRLDSFPEPTYYGDSGNVIRPIYDGNNYISFFNRQENEMTKKLYQTNEDPARFGTFLATNSAGKTVLEMKGSSGAVEAFDPKDIEEVLPWTFTITQPGDGRIFTYTGAKGCVEKGDLVMSREHNGVFTVSAVDTKSRNHQGTFKGRKLASTPIDSDDSE